MKPIFHRAFAAVIATTTLGVTANMASAGDVAYIPLGSDNKVLIVDTYKDNVTGTIKGLPAVHGLAKTPDGKFLIAGSYVGRAPGGKVPAKAAGVSKEDHAAHHKRPAAGALKPGAEISTLSIIRTADNTVVRRIDVPGAVHHVAVSPDGRYAILTHPSEDKVSVVDLKSYKVVANFATGAMPNYSTFSPDSSLVYVSNAANDTISAVDVKKWIVLWNATVGASPEHVVLSKDGAKLYVNNVEAGTVSVLDTATRKVVKTISVKPGLHGLDLSDDGKTLYVAIRSKDMVTAIDLATGKSRSLVLKTKPYHLAVIRGAGKIYVSSADKPKVWVVDAKNLKTIGEIAIGGKGHQIVQSSVY